MDSMISDMGIALACCVFMQDPFQKIGLIGVFQISDVSALEAAFKKGLSCLPETF